MRENIMKLLCYLACTFFIVSFVACRTTSGGVNVGWEQDSEIGQPHACKEKGKGGREVEARARLRAGSGSGYGREVGAGANGGWGGGGGE